MTKTIVLALAAVATTLGQTGTPTTPNLAPPKRVNVTAAVEVPIALVSGLPIVEAMLNGQGPFKFGIETGAGFSAIDPAAAARLKLEAFGGTTDEPHYRLDRVSIGAATFEDVEIAGLGGVSGGVDGILGLPFFQDVLMTLDYPAKRVRFERGSLPAANGVDILSISKVGPFWGLPIRVGGAAMTAVLDTRSMGGFSFTPQSAKGVAFDGPLQVIGRARGVAIAETEVKGGTLAGAIEIGQYSFSSPMVSVRSLPPGFPDEPLVGAQVLNNFAVTLDQKNQRLRLARIGSTSIDLSAHTPPAAATANAGGRAGKVPANDFTGEFEGDRVIAIVNGALTLNRGGRGQLTLVQTGPDAFGLEGIPAAKIEFVREGGTVVAMKVLSPQGEWETAKRVK